MISTAALSSGLLGHDEAWSTPLSPEDMHARMVNLYGGDAFDFDTSKPDLEALCYGDSGCEDLVSELQALDQTLLAIMRIIQKRSSWNLVTRLAKVGMSCESIVVLVMSELTDSVGLLPSFARALMVNNIIRAHVKPVLNASMRQLEPVLLDFYMPPQERVVKYISSSFDILTQTLSAMTTLDGDTAYRYKLNAEAAKPIRNLAACAVLPRASHPEELPEEPLSDLGVLALIDVGEWYEKMPAVRVPLLLACQVIMGAHRVPHHEDEENATRILDTLGGKFRFALEQIRSVHITTWLAARTCSRTSTTCIKAVRTGTCHITSPDDLEHMPKFAAHNIMNTNSARYMRLLTQGTDAEPQYCLMVDLDVADGTWTIPQVLVPNPALCMLLGSHRRRRVHKSIKRALAQEMALLAPERKLEEDSDDDSE